MTECQNSKRYIKKLRSRTDVSDMIASGGYADVYAGTLYDRPQSLIEKAGLGALFSAQSRQALAGVIIKELRRLTVDETFRRSTQFAVSRKENAAAGLSVLWTLNRLEEEARAQGTNPTERRRFVRVLTASDLTEDEQLKLPEDLRGYPAIDIGTPLYEQPFYMMEQINGTNAEDTRNDLSMDEKNSIAGQIVDMAVFLQDYDIVHGDYKLSNFMLERTDDGYHVVMIDPIDEIEIIQQTYTGADGEEKKRKLRSRRNMLTGTHGYLTPEARFRLFHYSDATPAYVRAIAERLPGFTETETTDFALIADRYAIFASIFRLFTGEYVSPAPDGDDPTGERTRDFLIDEYSYNEWLNSKLAAAVGLGKLTQPQAELLFAGLQHSRSKRVPLEGAKAIWQ
ncbi:MAG: hypothetical protein TR69_WS6001000231 [candidate division WS6 bacterium OLB20]|uniref:Protein kinase domain-containing protein n=1 Tax=candidate division WS6 bacterium OLB20 TaxID=1617426 RepID=A0A136M0D2_9BACT|nr:MAG: hypothetical protein TR69_WS6001000231 [candidate division WS6 bacterium OLB20]